jgi:hypothetical protein
MPKGLRHISSKIAQQKNLRGYLAMSEQLRPLIEWFTSEPNPRNVGISRNAAGGWRLHAIDCTDDPSIGLADTRRLKSKSALCGLSPRHGWGFDLFIRDQCERCTKAVARLKGVTK